MTAAASARPCELTLTLDTQHGEILRGFVREAALAEGIPAASAALLAGDCATAWQAIATTTISGHERAHVSVSVPHKEVHARLLLQGHARFAQAVTSLGGKLPEGAGVSCRESGVDGWEIVLHRSLVEPRDRAPQEPPPAAPAVIPAGADGIVIDLAQKPDAPGIARCFLAVYGHHYVHADVFSPRRYWARVAAGELIPVVARSAQGDVIGHVALEREAGAVVAERGEAVVLPEWRGHHLLERMTDRLSEEAPKHGLHGIYAEPLTIHTFSQRNDVKAGMPVCAALLGANPEDFRPKDIACPTAGQRQSYLRTFRFVQPATTRSVAPGNPYAEQLRKIYASLGVSVIDKPAGRALQIQSATRISVNDRGYGVIRFAAVGGSCSVELAQALADVRSLGARSVQLQARVDDPGLEQLVDAARAVGFFFCGIGPGFAEGDDLFLLQLLSEPLDTSKLQLFTDEAKALVAFIEQDRVALSP